MSPTPSRPRNTLLSNPATLDSQSFAEALRRLSQSPAGGLRRNISAIGLLPFLLAACGARPDLGADGADGVVTDGYIAFARVYRLVNGIAGEAVGIVGNGPADVS